MGFLPLIVAVMLVFGGAGVYAGFRVVDPLGLAGWARGLAWSFLLLPAAMPLLLIIDQLEVGRWLDLLLSATYLALGLISFLFVFAFLRDCAWLILRTGHSLLAVPEHLPATSVMLRTSSFIVLGLAVLFSAVAISNALSSPSVRSIQIDFANLHPDLQGFKIVQLSDLHLGVFRGAGFLAKVVGEVNRVSPDVVVITGDLTDGSVKKLRHTVLPLCDLEGPVLFVTGNHEYYWTPYEWIQYLEGLGIRVLLDASHTILHKDAKLLLVGISDPTSQVFFPQELSGIAASNAGPNSADVDLRVLLAHRPGTAYQAVSHGFDLQLSGHTHGGQFFPWNYVIHLVQPFAVGLHRFQDMWIYCSRGTGFWGPPMRLGAPAEITEITLSSRSGLTPGS
jgi:predicted MPP superfamily phosphohydrolase